MKIKKVLLFEHLGICNNIFNILNSYILKELNKRDIECGFINIAEKPDIVISNLAENVDESFDAVLAFNTPYYHDIATDGGENIYDKYNIAFYNWIVDHPVGSKQYLDTHCRNYNILCMDREHAEFVKKYRPDINSVTFLPLGGISADKNKAIVPVKDRKYDIVFPAGFSKMTLTEMMDVFNKMPDPNREIILNLIDYLMDNRSIEVTNALDTVLKERFGIENLYAEGYDIALSLAANANNFMRTYLREEVVRTLVNSNLDFHIFGNGWRERIGKEGAGTVYHKGVSFGETSDIFSDGKILLNVMPCFKDGTHDRIASGMLHRTIVMTDHSKYLDELPEGVIQFYNINDVKELPLLLEDLLNDMDKAQIIADGGYDYANEHFTWEKTVDALLEIMENND